jgi:glycosyltransferase involved in cell wall biosynthesis
MKVSVLTTTYNQEQYIAQALDGALMQETSFDFEMVVGEDCSTDGTRAIVQRYAEQHPDKVRALLNERNLGMHRNFIQAYRACRGEWIALCEGDDYWIAPDKLQRQVDFLTQHPECAVCFTNALVIHDNSDEEDLHCPPDQKEISDFVDLLEENFIPTSSIMFRNKLMLDHVPEKVLELMFGDWPLFLWQAQEGKIGYINEPMAVYRKHSAGLWSQVDPEKRTQGVVAMYQFLNEYFQHKYDPIIKVLIGRWKAYGRLWKDTAALQQRTLEQAKRIEELEHERRSLLQECERLKHAAPTAAAAAFTEEVPAPSPGAELTPDNIPDGFLADGALTIDYAFPVAMPYLVVGGWLLAAEPRFEEVALACGQSRPVITPYHARTEPRPDVNETLGNKIPAGFATVGFNLLIDTSGVDLPAVLHLKVVGGASYTIDLEPHLAVQVPDHTRRGVLRQLEPPRPAARPRSASGSGASPAAGVPTMV